MNWQDMSTAPDSRRVLVKRAKLSVGISQFDRQIHHKAPKPYWRDDRSWLAIADLRKDPPIAWMEIPE